MGQGVDAGLRSHGRGQGVGDRRIQHRVGRDQGKVIDDVLVPCLAVHDDGGQGGLASGAGCGGDGDQGRDLPGHL